MSYAACPFDDCPRVLAPGDPGRLNRHNRVTCWACVYERRFRAISADPSSFDAALDRILRRAKLDTESLAQRVSLVPYVLVLATLLTLAFFAGWFAASGFSSTGKSVQGLVNPGVAPSRVSPNVIAVVDENPVRAELLARGSSLVASSSAPPGLLPAGDASASTPEVVAARTNISVHDRIVLAAHEFDADPDVLLRVATCESRLDPGAIGDGGLAIGVFQFHAHTFVRFGHELGYDLTALGDPAAQARVAAWAFSNGYASHWSCK